MKNFTFLILVLMVFSCAKEINQEELLNENQDFVKAVELRNNGAKDSAFFYYNAAKETFLKTNNDLGMAKCLVNMGIIQTDKGDFYGGIETSIEAIEYLQKKDSLISEIRSSNFNNLAIANAELSNHQEAEKYYKLAIENTNNEGARFLYYNNLGNVYLDTKDYEIAKAYYTKALKTTDSISYARTLNNLGRCMFEENANFNALPYFEKSLKIRKEQKDQWGENSSYAALSDYYKNKSVDIAKSYAHEMLKVATALNSPDDRLEALQKLVFLEDPDRSKAYFVQYQKLDDSLSLARKKAKNQFALIRFGTEEEKRKNAESEIKILQRNIALGLFGLATIFAIFWYKRRKKDLEQEKAIEIKNTQLTYSKKVHDVASNGIYQVMSEIENNDAIDKNQVLDKLDRIYKKTRDISYDEMADNPNKDFQVQISELIASFSSDDLKPITIGNEEALWSKTSQKIKSETLLIIQELLVNMKKHSQAKRFSVIFELENAHLFLDYVDDGIGLGNDFYKKNGLQNMESRIFSLGGTITFDKTIRTGTKIKVAVPLN